jgi:hypothetical protein
MEQPSTRHRTIWERSEVLSLFILNILLDNDSDVKHNVHLGEEFGEILSAPVLTVHVSAGEFTQK